jgi:hypothetical protein
MWSWMELLGTSGISSRKAILVGAFAVHVWLLLFACGVLIVRGLNSARRAAVWMQWFLKGGDKHPLRAIGFVTAAVTFILVGILQYGFS